jgi:hypothetical protein
MTTSGAENQYRERKVVGARGGTAADAVLETVQSGANDDQVK